MNGNTPDDQLIVRVTASSLSAPDGSAPTRAREGQASTPTLDDILWDRDGVSYKDMQESGAITDPQVVAALVPEGIRNAALWCLFEADPAVGSAVVYGTLMIRGTQYFLDALDEASEMIAWSESAAAPETHLLIHAIDRALASRDLSELEQECLPEYLSRYRAIRDARSSEPETRLRESIEDRFPAFARRREAIDIIHRSASAGSVPGSLFFDDTAPTVDNYLKAVFGALIIRADSPMQQAALELLRRLDPTLHGMFQFGLQRQYLSNRGPTRLRLDDLRRHGHDGPGG
jgi:hypothetical protein